MVEIQLIFLCYSAFHRGKLYKLKEKHMPKGKHEKSVAQTDYEWQEHEI